MGKEQKNRASPLAGFNNFFCKLPLSFQVEKRRFFSMDRKIFHPAWGLAHDFARTTILNLSTDLTRAKSGACPHGSLHKSTESLRLQPFSFRQVLFINTDKQGTRHNAMAGRQHVRRAEL
jgi:hypothetical protein